MIIYCMNMSGMQKSSRWNTRCGSVMSFSAYHILLFFIKITVSHYSVRGHNVSLEGGVDGGHTHQCFGVAIDTSILRTHCQDSISSCLCLY